MQFSFIKSSLNTTCITSFYGKRQYGKISKLQNRLICLLDGKILCRFTQPQNKPYAFSTKPMMLIMLMYTHFDAKFVTFWILKTKNSSNQIFVVARFGIVKSGHSLFKIQVIFFRESTFVAFDKSAFITSCATQSDELFRKIIAMHGFLTACASWTRQHAETAAFAANRSHSIYILKQLRN